MGEIKSKPKFYVDIIWKRLRTKDPCKKCLVRAMCSKTCQDSIRYMTAKSLFNIEMYNQRDKLFHWWKNFSIMDCIIDRGMILFACLCFCYLLYLDVCLILLIFDIYLPIIPFTEFPK